MFEATEKAVEMIKEFFKEKNTGGAIRVMMAGGG
jgi:Fe-S cluster assembly iron-binding protein IscA